MITFVASTLFFLLLHVIITGRSQQPFHIALKIARGYAAAVLTLVGIFSLFYWHDLWREAFLVRHEHGSLGYHIVWFVIGHLVADFLWLAYGYYDRESRPRSDLIIHHAAGLIACAAALYLQAGYAAIGVALSSEIMPVTTGIGAWGRARGDRRIEMLAVRLRLVALVGWRIPLWLFILTMVIVRLGTGVGDRTALFVVALLAVVFVLGLDVFWTARSFGRSS